MLIEVTKNSSTGKYEVETNVTSGGADLESNKTQTIDVSAYTDPVEITPTQGKDGMKKATVTLSNIPNGADIESNKSVTIDVSQYSAPVEITSTAGKDGMAKATVTLSNIPSGGDVTAYAWQHGATLRYFPTSKAPTDWSEFAEKCAFAGTGNREGKFSVDTFAEWYEDYAKVSDSEFIVYEHGTGTHLTRDSTKDFTLWQTT